MSKRDHQLEDYILLSFPENPAIFGVERKAHGAERFAKKDPQGEELGPIYDTVIHIISPYFNYQTGEKTESCNCLSWRTRRRRCVHLKKFYQMNPQEDPRKNQGEDFNIYEETILHAGVIANKAAKESKNQNYQEISRLLEIKTEKEYKENPEFREQLKPCRNGIKSSKEEKQATKTWLLEKMKKWAKTI